MRPLSIRAFSTLAPLLALALSAWPRTYISAQPECTDSNSTGDCLRLNQIQVLGSHNSYKRWPAQALINHLNAYRQDWARDISYEHRPLREQLVVDVDNDIWAVFDREHVITPDDVRGQADSLEQAILNQGWRGAPCLSAWIPAIPPPHLSR